MMKKFHPLKFLKKHRRGIFITLAVLGILSGWSVLSYGSRTAENLQCRTVCLPEGTLPGAGKLRIAFLSDLHNNPEMFEKAVCRIEAEKPDIIIFGGDLVTATNRFSRTAWAVKGFRRLVETAPCFAVLGNHDYEKKEQVERVYSTAGVRLLRNEALDWTTPAGTTLRIVGLGDHNEGDEAPELCLLRQGAEQPPVLLVSHDPESRWLLRRYNWDFMLSGHTHGGQIGHPFTGDPISFRSSMPAGLFPFEGGRHVFVTRGVGAIFNIRFFCPPELNIIEQKS